jgi:hypothetical protein
MRPRAFRSLVFAAAVLSIAGIPAIAQDKWGYDGGMKTAADWNHSQNMAFKAVLDQGLSTDDIISVLPLLTDLRDAEHMRMFSNDVSANDFNSQRSSIWKTISDRIGSTKADSLRKLVEPVAEDVSASYTKSVHIQRIESLLAEWDRESAARIAAYGGTSETTPVVVETTTITTTTIPMAPIWVYSAPPMDIDTLVKKMEMKLARDSAMDQEALIYLDTHRDLNSTDLAFIQEKSLRAWD